MADKGSAQVALRLVRGPLLLDFLVTHLDLTVDDESWEARDKVGALTLITVDERIVHVLLLQVVLLLGAPWA